MWRKHRISCITYRKYAKEDWPETRFSETEVKMPNGETVRMKLAEMGTWIGSREDGLWVREIRKLGKGGHQTSLVTTVYDRLGPETAGLLFSRWSQENFFRYMMEHYGIDALAEYRTEKIPGTDRPVVNPARRELDQCYHSLRAKLTYRQAKFTSLTLHPEADDSRMEAWEGQKAALLEQIQELEKNLGELKERRKNTPKHLAWEDLPEKERFERLAPGRKRLIDTVKMLAYRAETALAMIAREKLSHPDEARALIRDLLRSDADIYPNQAAGILEVRLHALANPRSNRAVQHLLDHLNAAEFVYPGTNFRLTYCLVGTGAASES
jgi:hypothetical protein